MKKLVISMIAVVSAIIMCFALAGCSKDVKGNTYVFDDVVIEGTIPDEAKDYIDQTVASMKEYMSGMTIKFNDDGTCTLSSDGEEAESGYYKQDGDKVYVSETKEGLDGDDSEVYEVDGSKLVQSGSEGGMTIKVIFKKK